MPDARMPNALVVDDDITGRSFLGALLKRAGYAVEVAASGEAALAMFQPGAFDVVFMDLLMPGIDGIETTRRLKRISGTTFTPVIFVTGAADEDSLVRAIEAGGDDFLGKPVTPAILLAKLSAMERIRRLHARTQALYARVIEDQELVRAVFDRAVTRRAFTSPALRSRLVPAEVFSGDFLLGGLAGAGAGIPARVLEALHEFRRGTPFADDVTVVELALVPALFESTASAAGGKGLARPTVEAA